MSGFTANVRDDRLRGSVTRFIHICASQNDLFALDEEGDVYQYNFHAKTWVKLVGSRADELQQPRVGAHDEGDSMDSPDLNRRKTGASRV